MMLLKSEEVVKMEMYVVCHSETRPDSMHIKEMIPGINYV